MSQPNDAIIHSGYLQKKVLRVQEPTKNMLSRMLDQSKPVRFRRLFFVLDKETFSIRYYDSANSTTNRPIGEIRLNRVKEIVSKSNIISVAWTSAEIAQMEVDFEDKLLANDEDEQIVATTATAARRPTLGYDFDGPTDSALIIITLSRSYTLFTESQPDERDWMTKFNLILEELSPRQVSFSQNFNRSRSNSNLSISTTPTSLISATDSDIPTDLSPLAMTSMAKRRDSQPLSPAFGANTSPTSPRNDSSSSTTSVLGRFSAILGIGRKTAPAVTALDQNADDDSDGDVKNGTGKYVIDAKVNPIHLPYSIHSGNVSLSRISLMYPYMSELAEICEHTAMETCNVNFTEDINEEDKEDPDDDFFAFITEILTSSNSYVAQKLDKMTRNATAAAVKRRGGLRRASMDKIKRKVKRKYKKKKMSGLNEDSLVLDGVIISRKNRDIIHDFRTSDIMRAIDKFILSQSYISLVSTPLSSSSNGDNQMPDDNVTASRKSRSMKGISFMTFTNTILEQGKDIVGHIYVLLEGFVEKRYREVDADDDSFDASCICECTCVKCTTGQCRRRRYGPLIDVLGPGNFFGDVEVCVAADEHLRRGDEPSSGISRTRAGEPGSPSRTSNYLVPTTFSYIAVSNNIYLGKKTICTCDASDAGIGVVEDSDAVQPSPTNNINDDDSMSLAVLFRIPFLAAYSLLCKETDFMNLRSGIHITRFWNYFQPSKIALQRVELESSRWMTGDLGDTVTFKDAIVLQKSLFRMLSCKEIMEIAIRKNSNPIPEDCVEEGPHRQIILISAAKTRQARLLPPKTPTQSNRATQDFDETGTDCKVRLRIMRDGCRDVLVERGQWHEFREYEGGASIALQMEYLDVYPSVAGLVLLV